jgi:hypothetical protein
MLINTILDRFGLMFIQLIVHVLLMIFFLLSRGAMTQLFDCINTTEAICDGSLPTDNGIHPKHECSADLFSQVELSSCENGNHDDTIFWFWYDDVCRFNEIADNYFVSVSPNNVSQCKSTLWISIPKNTCENEYNVTRQSMIIKNITDSTSQKYICIRGRSLLNLLYSSTIIYSINISG